ncbi:hypothetical protein AAFF_G00357380 [Aldrovandia affinis]|uniref:Uncharacterized protein n=1 Tax=Aldrovandia affinis TaxID=143900 RepID=A0AAD7T8S8_9TELE|nr:hypothetical protein AAFF_G00357380 [Aldrovandia affinis]
MGISRDYNLKNVLCNGTFLEFNSTADKEAFENISCALTPQELRETRKAFQQNLNVEKLASKLPQALDLNPVETFGLVSKTVVDALPVIEQISRLQNSMLFNAANSLDFRSDIIARSAPL